MSEKKTPSTKPSSLNESAKSVPLAKFEGPKSPAKQK